MYTRSMYPTPGSHRRPRWRQKEYQSKPELEAKLPKKRCLNCPKFFPLTKPNRRFCSINCKNEYNRFGSSYGPLKAKLEKLIEQTIAAGIAHQLRDRNSELWQSVKAKVAELGFLNRADVSTRRTDAMERTWKETEARIEGVRMGFDSLAQRIFLLEHQQPDWQPEASTAEFPAKDFAEEPPPVPSSKVADPLKRPQRRTRAGK